MQPVQKDLEKWLKLFSKAVRERDFTAARNFFDDDVTSFGTAGFRMENLDELVARQWRIVWPQTADFDFEYASARAIVTENLALVVTEWTSTGFGAANQPFLRRGRATIGLKKSPTGWKATHTHFSIAPVANSAHDPILQHAGS